MLNALFLSFCTMSFSTRVMLLLETILFDNEGLTTPQNFLLFIMHVFLI